MQLRGRRYGDGLTPEFHAYVECMQELSYKEACSVYRDVEGKLGRQQIAFLACNDRFYFLTRILNRTDAIHPWVYQQCRMVEREPDGFLDLWARYHYKTSIITTAGSLQEIACNPDVTIALFSVTSKVARKFLRGLQEAMETNANLPLIFPDVFWKEPRKEAPLWALDQGLTVIRKQPRNEPTLSAWGLVDGMPTGGHWDILLYNDIITEKTVTNQEMVEKSTVAYELSTNLGIGEGTRKRLEGTRYSFGDTYGHLIERGIVKPRIYAATHDGKEGDHYIADIRTGKPARADTPLDLTEKRINPIFVSLEQWQNIKREQRSTYAAQMLQNPLAGKQNTFAPSTLRRYLMRPRTLNVYIMGDYASGEKRDKKTDYSAFVAVGIDHAGNKYLLDGARYRMSLTERWAELKRLYNRWTKAEGVQMVNVGYERYGAQSDIQYFYEEMKKPDEPKFHITELNWPREGLGSKSARIQRLEPDFTANKFYLPAKVWRPNAVWWVDRYGRERIGLKPESEEGTQKSGPRDCLWKVDPDTDKIEYRPIPFERLFLDERGDIVGENTPGARLKVTNRPALMEEERTAKTSGERYRIMESLKKNDPVEGSPYDLTAVLIEEFIFDPFSLHDDVVDVLSRIYDMQPSPARLYEANALLHEEWSD
jgi:hypothetical protein